MATVLGGDTMGPECTFPNQTEELGLHQGPTEGTGNWSTEEPEEEQKETGAGPVGYFYQSVPNQDPEPEEVELAPVGDGENVVVDIQDRVRALGLHLPNPPFQSNDEDEEGATTPNNHSSIPMYPEYVELVKRTMAGVSLPTPGPPAWAWEISDAQWEDVVQKVLQAWQASPAWKQPSREAPYLPAFQPGTSTELNTSLVVMPISILPISLPSPRQIRLLLRDPLYSVLCMWGHWPKPSPPEHVSLWRLKHPVYTSQNK
ncbi:LOW QUALITY PROTEIN: male-enhanced antigen 1-like [Glossophaga mutica]